MKLKRLLELAGIEVKETTVQLNEWQKDINNVDKLIDMLEQKKKKHGNFSVLVSNDGATIHIYPGN